VHYTTHYTRQVDPGPCISAVIGFVDSRFTHTAQSSMLEHMWNDEV
jgi:hypothetical protein